MNRCKECGRADGRLLDCRAIMDEYGVSRAVAEAWIRQLPKVHQPGGVRKTYIRRQLLDDLLREAEVA